MNFAVTVGTEEEALVCLSCDAVPCSLEVRLTDREDLLVWVIVVKVKDVLVILITTSFTPAALIVHKVTLTLLNLVSHTD